MTRSDALCLVTLAAVVLGCGGTSPSRSYTKIDDMEGPENAIQWIGPPGTRPGSWFAATDCSQADRIDPPSTAVVLDGWSYAALPKHQETMPGIFSAHATRLRTTTPLVGIWGASAGIAFAVPLGVGPPDAGVSTDDAGACLETDDYPNPPVDLTSYAGVTFWARAASPGARNMRVHVNDVNTDPRGGICQAVDSSASTYCYNGFGVQIELTDTFQRYTLDFSQFMQRGGWGYHPPDGIDWSRIFTMSFEMDLPSCSTSAATMCPGGAPSLSFDVWIDDLYFVNK